MKIGIIIPTVFKHDCTDLSNAITSLYIHAKKYQHFELSFLIFVDKAPIDFSANTYQQILKKATNLQVQVMWSHNQIGFTGTVNQAVTVLSLEKKHDWLLVFNDDAVALPNFWTLTKKLAKQQTGIVSGGVLNWHGGIESVGVQANGWGMTLPITDVSFLADQQTLSPQKTLFSGTYFFVSVATVKQLLQLNGFFFFPLFFAYSEDFELGVRLHRLGLPISVVPKSLIKHKGSQTSKRGSSFQLFYGLRNDWFVHQLHQDLDWRFFAYLLRYWCYVIMLCCYKGYWLLPAKIALSHWKNRATINFWRTLYDQQLPYHYSF
jgi:GT2 family glycosyltransferase